MAATVVADCGTTAYEPQRIDVTCTNSSVVATEIRWSGWSSTRATGTAVVELNRCQPTCSASSAVPYPASITLTDPVMSAGGARFSQAQITWSGSLPLGHPSDTYALSTTVSK
jgi:hypothetical protein